jgi:hypothetical protein
VRNGTGPQLAIEQMTTYFEACEVDADPCTLAIHDLRSRARLLTAPMRD